MCCILASLENKPHFVLAVDHGCLGTACCAAGGMLEEACAEFLPPTCTRGVLPESTQLPPPFPPLRYPSLLSSPLSSFISCLLSLLCSSPPPPPITSSSLSFLCLVSIFPLSLLSLFSSFSVLCVCLPHIHHTPCLLDSPSCAKNFLPCCLQAKLVEKNEFFIHFPIILLLDLREQNSGPSVCD